jgi:hypothetical protein
VQLIKFILVIAVVAVALLAFRNRYDVGIRAGARLAALALAAFAIASIIDTAIPQALANAMGVTRGTDLVLYTLVVVFAMTATGLYLRTREIERTVALIVRSAAIRDSVLVWGMPRTESADPPVGPDEL